MQSPEPRPIVFAAFSYAAAAFAAGFVLGTLRTLVVTPRTGALAAVLAELPVMLALCWIIAGRVLRRWPDAARGTRERLALGGIALVWLIAAEVTLAAALGQPFLSALATPPGLAGLAGQFGFALIPALRR